MRRSKSIYNDEQNGFILALIKRGMKYKDIIEHVDEEYNRKPSLSKVSRVFHKIKGDLSKRGRRLKFTEQEEFEIIKIIKKMNFESWSKICYKIKIQLRKSISIPTLKKIVKKNSVKCYRRKRKPMIDNRIAKKRLNFANKYVSKPMSYLQKIAFADEKTLLMKGKILGSRLYSKCTRNDLYKPEFIEQKLKYNFTGVKVWAISSWNGVSDLLFLDGKWNSKKYQEVIYLPIKKAMEKLKFDIIFEDGEPVKRCSSTKAFYRRKNIKVVTIPPNSPDINFPIECLWSRWQQQVFKKRPNSISSLRLFAKEEWSKITRRDKRKMISKMKNILMEIIKAKGFSSKY